MKIINLIEDSPGAPGCIYEHGLSFYVETMHHKVLVDTGADDAFLQNAKILGVDLTTVDTVIISHGHYDHAGGLLSFLEINKTAAIYMQKSAVKPFYNLKYSVPKYIGIDPDIVKSDRVTFLEGNLKIDDELTVFTGAEGRTLWPEGNKTLKVQRGDAFLQDPFDHEQYLVVTEREKKVLLSGCAHNGILNILERYRILFGGAPHYVISGFHTSKKEYMLEDDALIQETAERLAQQNTVYYTGHCTGEYPMQIFKKIMGEKLVLICSGKEIL